MAFQWCAALLHLEEVAALARTLALILSGAWQAVSEESGHVYQKEKKARFIAQVSWRCLLLSPRLFCQTRSCG